MRRFRMFCSKDALTLQNTYLLSCWFHFVDIFYIKFRFCEYFTVTNSVTRISLIYPITYLHIYVLVWFKFRGFVYPTLLSCVLHSIGICIVAIKSTRNMQAFSTNRIADILHFNDNKRHFCPIPSNNKTG